MATCLPQGTNSDNFYGSLKFEVLVDCSLQYHILMSNCLK